MQFPVFERGELREGISTCVFSYGKRPKMIAYVVRKKSLINPK